MKYCFALAFIFCLQTDAAAQRVRRLLLFAVDSTSTQLQLQRKWLEAASEGVESRDIWLAVFDDPKKFRRMYDHYEVGRADFHIVLVGKDFNIIFRSDEPVPAEKIFEIIDGLPQPQAGN